MKKISPTAVVVAAIVGVLVLAYVFTGISVRNNEAAIRAQFNAVQNSNRVDYDAMWKVIAQTAQVPTQYTADFKDAYTAVLNSGPNDDKTVKNLFAVASGMKVPQLDSSLYRKVQDVIESERNKFRNSQNQLLDIKREHDKLRTTFPGSLYVGNVPPLEAQLVTSTKTDAAFDSGKEDDVSVFEKK